MAVFRARAPAENMPCDGCIPVPVVRSMSLMRFLARRRLPVGVALVAVVAAVLAAARPAAAMTFALERDEQGRQVVVARGPIEAGDAARLHDALQAAGRDASGNKLLILDSPGGPIVDAFAMVGVMDAEHVSTRVRAGANCASSCAMIVFVSGTFRTVEEGGRLGVHTCHDATSRQRSMACNDLIAQNALQRGVLYVSSLTLLHLTAPGEVHWLDAATAACWQLSRPETAVAGQAAPPANPGACPTPLATPITRGR
jgi:hypothetical protein